jgi:exosortase/archaeosortase family protein
VSERTRQGLLLGAIFGAGWLAAAQGGVAVWDQAAALAALAMVFFRGARAGTRALGSLDAAALGLAGVGLTLGWAWPAALAAALVVMRPEAGSLPRLRLMLWAMLAVPWLAADAAAVGWFFRWTGAWFAGVVFQGLGFEVVRQGTWLRVEDQPLAVDAACAGLDTLQATLVAGLWLAESLRTKRAWVWGVLLLPLLAWFANALRICLLGAVALSEGYDAATGWFHTWGGLGVLLAVFVLAAAWIGWLRSREAAP